MIQNAGEGGPGYPAEWYQETAWEKFHLGYHGPLPGAPTIFPEPTPEQPGFFKQLLTNLQAFGWPFNPLQYVGVSPTGQPTVTLNPLDAWKTQTQKAQESAVSQIILQNTPAGDGLFSFEWPEFKWPDLSGLGKGLEKFGGMAIIGLIALAAIMIFRR